jgi:tetratricopeptide (TPR) repeat protein
MGKLDDARDSYLAAMSAAREFGATSKVRRAEDKLVVVDIALGRLEEALPRAIALRDSMTEPSAAQSLANCYIWMGRYDEALDALRDAICRGTERVWTTVSAESRATALLECARLCGHLSLYDEADSLIASCDESLQNVARHRHKVAVSRAIIDCYRSQFDSARKALDTLEPELDQILSSAFEAKSCLPLMARAYLMLRDFDRAKTMLAHRRHAGVYPVAEPRYFLYLGQSEAGIGNLDAARDAYKRAVSLGIDTADSRIAREKLGLLSSPTGQ